MHYAFQKEKILILSMLLSLCGGTSFFLLAIIAPSPLQISVVSEHTTGEEETVDSLVLKVSNHAAVAIKPDYVISVGPYVPTPWIPVEKNLVIPPGKTEYIKLIASNIDVMPSIENQFRVFAFSENPYSVSYTSVNPLTNLHTLLTPLGIRKLLMPGQSFVIHVQLLNQIGSPVLKSNVPIALTQLIYSPQGIEFSGERINNALPGATPVTAYTNNDGVATFHIKEIQPENQEVNFQAWIADKYPVAYSNQLTVWFGPIVNK
jgi:hypothetical protein